MHGDTGDEFYHNTFRTLVIGSRDRAGFSAIYFRRAVCSGCELSL
jgi:hypothetical protein